MVGCGGMVLLPCHTGRAIPHGCGPPRAVQHGSDLRGAAATPDLGQPGERGVLSVRGTGGGAPVIQGAELGVEGGEGLVEGKTKRARVEFFVRGDRVQELKRDLGLSSFDDHVVYGQPQNGLSSQRCDRPSADPFMSSGPVQERHHRTTEFFVQPIEHSEMRVHNEYDNREMLEAGDSHAPLSVDDSGNVRPLTRSKPQDWLATMLLWFAVFPHVATWISPRSDVGRPTGATGRVPPIGRLTPPMECDQWQAALTRPTAFHASQYKHDSKLHGPRAQGRHKAGYGWQSGEGGGPQCPMMESRS